MTGGQENRLALVETESRLESSAAHDVRSAEVVVVDGPDAGSWLQGQMTQDLGPIGVGDAADTLALSPQGRIEGFGTLARLGEQTWWIVTEAGYGAALEERLRRFKLRVKATLDLVPVTVLAVRGPDSPALADELLAGRPASATLPVAWASEVGLDLLVDSAPHGGPAPGDPEAFEALRVEAGRPRLGRELAEKTLPHEAGLLVEHAVSLTKGCYTGQELVARIDARGANVPRHLRLVEIPAAPGETSEAHGDGAPRAGDAVVSGGDPAGSLTSVAWSTRAAGFVALAPVKRAVAVPSDIEIVPAAGSSGRKGRLLVLPGSPAAQEEPPAG